MLHDEPPPAHGLEAAARCRCARRDPPGSLPGMPTALRRTRRSFIAHGRAVVPFGFALLAARADAADAEADRRAIAPAPRRSGRRHRDRRDACHRGRCGGRTRSPRASSCFSTATRRGRRRVRRQPRRPDCGQLALRYLAEWRHVRPLLRGDDLQRSACPPVRRSRRTAAHPRRAARRLGDDHGDERALALRFAKSIRDSSAANADIELHVNGH